MPDNDSNFLRFRFTGGLADRGELNFYEHSRSQYAAARLIYTIAKYQETGKVVARLTDKTKADIRARPPVEGSFEYDAVVFLSMAAAQAAVQIPIEALFVYIYDHILAPFNPWAGLRHEAQLERARLESRTHRSLSREETKRLEIARQIAHDEQVTKRKALKFAEKILEDQSISPDSSTERISSLKLLVGDLRCEINRDSILDPYEEQLNEISDEDRAKLFGKARPLVSEIGLPLRGSADLLGMSVGANDNTVGLLNHGRAKEVRELDPDENSETLEGKIVQFHTENGYGRFKPQNDAMKNEFGGEVGFRVLRQMKSNLSPVVLDAMKEDVVTCEFLVSRDVEGNVKSLVLLSVEEE